VGLVFWWAAAWPWLLDCQKDSSRLPYRNVVAALSKRMLSEDSDEVEVGRTETKMGSR
jgi:hypothetical protein